MNRFVRLLVLLMSVVARGQHPPHPKLAQTQAEYRLAKAQHDTLAMAEAAYLMGKRYRSSGDYVSSRRWLLYSLRIRELRGPSVELNKVYIQLAGDAGSLENYDEAFTYARRALANSRKLNHPHSLMSAYSLLGTLHRQVAGQRIGVRQESIPSRGYSPADSAIWYLNRAEDIAVRLNALKDVASARLLKGSILAKRDPQKAIPLFRYALAVYFQNELYNNCADIHTQLSRAYLALRQLPEARQHLTAAQGLYQTRKPVDAGTIANIQYGWADWHHASGHWQLAYRYLKKADSLWQQNLNQEQRALIARLNVTYETDRRENLLKAQRAELALRETHLQAQRNYTHTALSLLVIAAVVGLMFYRLNQQNKRISLQNAQLVQEQNHRMKNNLQTISGLLSLQSNQLVDAEAKRAVSESQLRVETMAQLNRTLYDTDQLTTPGLPTVIPDIVQSILHSYGYDDVQPVYELEPIPVHTDQSVSIILIVNELVTNACKYAFPGNPAPTLRIRGWQEKNQLRLRVQDNGPGLPETADPAGFGMRLIAMQVRQLRAESVVSGPPGLTFDLTAPIKL